MSKKDTLAAGKVDFLPFANNDTSNVIDQATYASLATRSTGFVAGVAQSAQLNKVWRQSSLMTAALALYISNVSNVDVIDDGNVSNLADKIAKSVKDGAKGGVTSFNARQGDVTLTKADVDAVSGFVDFAIVEEGGKLVFKFKGNKIASMDSGGNITTLANVTAFSPSV